MADDLVLSMHFLRIKSVTSRSIALAVLKSRSVTEDRETSKTHDACVSLCMLDAIMAEQTSNLAFSMACAFCLSFGKKTRLSLSTSAGLHRRVVGRRRQEPAGQAKRSALG